MILISHRANLFGPDKTLENHPLQIMYVMNMGYEVEIDVWVVNNKIFLGHDFPEHEINLEFLFDNRLWCHAKNLEALQLMLSHPKIHCFWHENDKVTLTSKNYVWTFPGNELISNSIACMPETKEFINIEKAIGICSDFITKYK